jgi:hypothetical protein
MMANLYSMQGYCAAILQVIRVRRLLVMLCTICQLVEGPLSDEAGCASVHRHTDLVEVWFELLCNT